jgi:hypothetical protein
MSTTVCKPFGLQAEGYIIQLLKEAGYTTIKSTQYDDCNRKIDFWVEIKDGSWLGIQFTINKYAIINSKGIDALNRGLCPSWLDGQELYKAFNGHPELKKKLLGQFWIQVKKFVSVRPDLITPGPEAKNLKSRFAYSN